MQTQGHTTVHTFTHIFPHIYIYTHLEYTGVPLTVGMIHVLVNSPSMFLTCLRPTQEPVECQDQEQDRSAQLRRLEVG